LAPARQCSRVTVAGRDLRDDQTAKLSQHRDGFSGLVIVSAATQNAMVVAAKRMHLRPVMYILLNFVVKNKC